MKSGTTFPADQELEAGDYLYAKVSDMNLPGNEVYMRFSKAHVSASTAGSTPIPAGAVIFPKRGGAIGTNKKRILEKDTCVDLNTMGVIPGERLLTEYLYQFFINTDLMSLADGSTIPQLNNRQIAPVRIIVPPFDKQEAFRDIFQQSDKSKHVALQATLSGLVSDIMKLL
ncbi:MAG: restriction endonuclease subunit S, partial [Lachnospiraceae bacterium]|nr:restriction endonuclease subunit S [Lachnospiraceae bacterium]